MPAHDSLYAGGSTLDYAIVALIKHALTSAQDFLGGEFPMRQTETHWYEKVDGGSGYKGRSERQNSPDRTIWWRLRDDLSSSGEWVTATTAIERYMEATGSAIEPDWITHETLCQQVLGHYLLGVRSFKFSNRQAKATCRALRAYCESPEDRWEALIAFTGLIVERPFKLDADIAFRPISPQELRRFGMDDDLSHWGSLVEQVTPRNDWWIATVCATGPKGAVVAHNRTSTLSSRLLECFPLFQSGALRAIEISSARKGPFGLGVTGRGRWTQLGVGESSYELSRGDVRRLKTFWQDYRLDAPERDHYLGLSARRLKSGVERSAPEDALVDFVIGLESLLSKPNDQTELRYRFAVRGAALLARTRSERYERFKELQEIYDLRSRVVHGRRAEPERLKTLAAIAEQSLRQVWRSYFDQQRDASNADRVIDQIDRAFLED